MGPLTLSPLLENWAHVTWQGFRYAIFHAAQVGDTWRQVSAQTGMTVRGRVGHIPGVS